MGLIFRRRRKPVVAEPVPVASPTPQTDRILLALAVHAQQLDDRVTHLEHRLDALACGDLAIVATKDDLLDVQRHSAQVAAELAGLAITMRRELDQVASRIPALLAEDERHQRARTFAESILDLSDALDTVEIDLRGPPAPWSATVA